MTDWSTILFAKGGSIALMLGMSVAIVVFLRLLYGPSGIFRSSTWSEHGSDVKENNTNPKKQPNIQLNDNHKEQKNNIKKQTVPNQLVHSQTSHSNAVQEQIKPLQSTPVPFKQNDWFKEHIKHFTAYSRSFFTKDATIDLHLDLKYEHTLNVVTNAQYIATNEPVFADKQLNKACLLAALYHDVGRFLQFTTYHTFSDALSCDHGYLSAQVLTREQFLQAELPKVRHLTKLAVALHNKHTLNPLLPKKYLTVLTAVRDADKLDIFRIMANNLGKNKTPDPIIVMHLENSTGKYSPLILEQITTDKPPSFLDMRYVNDFRLLLCSWVNDLHFKATRQKALHDNYLALIIDGLDGLDALKPKMNTYITKKLNANL